MIKEEWRMHSLLFGGRTFLLFPLVILLMTVPAYWALLASGFAPATLRTGLHYLTLFFGLNVGAIGFVSRDAIKNLLGEANLLIFSSRTLPVSRIRLVGTFLAKDLLYYSFLFLTPIVVAVVPAEVSAGHPVNIPALLWVTTAGTFMAGVALSFLFASLYNRGRAYLLTGLAGFGGLLWYFNLGILEFTPVAFHAEPTIDTFLFGFVPSALVMGLGLLVFTPGIESSRQTYGNTFPWLREKLRWIDRHGLVTKFVLDIQRSSGGFTKLLFSVGIILAVFIVMVDQLFFARGFLQAGALSFALILSIASISVYNWINRFDTPGRYSSLPVDTGDVFIAKYITFFLLAVPINVLYLLGASRVYGTTGLITGLVVIVPLMLYVLGVTAYLTGLDPNQMLMNGTYFLIYTGAMGVVFVPLFIWTLVYGAVPDVVTAGMTGLALVAGLGGYLLARRAPSRWDNRS